MSFPSRVLKPAVCHFCHVCQDPGLVCMTGLAHVTDLACLAERDDLKDKHAYLVVQMLLSEVQISFSSVSYLLCLCNIFLFLLLLYK